MLGISNAVVIFDYFKSLKQRTEIVSHYIFITRSDEFMSIIPFVQVWLSFSLLSRIWVVYIELSQTSKWRQ